MHSLRPLALGLALLGSALAQTTTKPIPEPLRPWTDWATWNAPHRDCPTPYSDAKKHLCFWPSRLALEVTKTGAKFELGVTVFHDTWVPLPGGSEVWPLTVAANGAPVAVVEHGGSPAARLAAGTYRLSGTYRWADTPQRIPLPSAIGILALTLDGKPIEAPAWDAEGFLWLRRDPASEEVEKEFLSVKFYAALEDGIPLWLRTEIELTVAGKSREEDLGTILPEGWKLAAVESPIPVSVDDTGKMKAQVRAGKWTVRAAAFRLDNPKEFRYAEGARVAAAEQLVAFRARPDFRTVEIVGAPSIDVSQTVFPDAWRELPVYRWETNGPFRLEERMRGMGEQKPAGLSIAREWWLDEGGRELTFRDTISGQMQQIWRLDAASGQALGSVRSGGQGQLITLNPQTAAPGVEIRSRAINLEATGRMARGQGLPATGWQADADDLRVTLHLPPGWRLFALFGADWVQGDWLTAWTLLDLFLLLIFTLAVFRLWGLAAAALAFVAFGLSYHEAGAPRAIWLLLLIPIALQRVVPVGWGQKLLGIAKWTFTTIFILLLVPFVTRQLQQALYPQLEVVGAYEEKAFGVVTFRAQDAPPDFQANSPGVTEDANAQSPAAIAVPEPAQRQGWEKDEYSSSILSSSRGGKKAVSKGNLLYDSKARIQTGPGIPEWEWREVGFGWSGPVQATQQVRPVLISESLERVISVVRVIVLLALAVILLNARKLGGVVFRRGGKAVALALLAFGATANAQLPDKETLELLRERLLAPADAYPTAADIPSVTLTLKEGRLTLDAEIHTAIRTAVPLPGKLPAWSPLSVLVNDKPEAALRREDGSLWVVLDQGVHRVRVEALLARVTEWEWSFALKPRLVTIDAPDWTFSGVRPDGVPEAQVFFVLKQKTAAGQASYERQDLQTIAVIDRHLELGLVWQVRTTVTRLSPAGKAIALRVPLLPGENVLSSNAMVKDGFIEVRLGAQEQSFEWESGLAAANALKLATRAEDAWVERWHLIASPVWNVALSGLPPVFEADVRPPVTLNRTIAAAGGDLVPRWQPWPGESVDLTISRPEAVAGATVTVSRAAHETTLGKRQRVAQLDLALRCSLGEDFLVDLPADAEITALTHAGKAIPVRKDGTRLIIPLRPGEQTISIGWKTNVPLTFRAEAEAVRLPVESANISTTINVPDDRWVLWAQGPRRGPAVRFWVVLVCSLVAALALGRTAWSPLGIVAWMLLVIGLTQVPLSAALLVIGWLFFLGWRGRESFQTLGHSNYNFLQVALIGLTAVALGILLYAVSAGLLGNPEMFIRGNGSTRTALRWFQARAETLLPQPECLSISIWWYRLLMLAWALWLAASLLRWLRWGWQNFSKGGFFRRAPVAPVAVPPLPKPADY